MTGGTALEIYFNPDDIEIYIGKEKDKNDVWGLCLSRGPRSDHHPFKLLLSSNENSNLTKGKTLEILRDTLNSAKEFGDKIFTSNDYGLLKILVGCGDSKSKNEYVRKIAPVLEDSDIKRIMTELEDEEKCSSSTYQWKIWKYRYHKKSICRWKKKANRRHSKKSTE
ncbi:MAG: hypothetical protein WDK96_02115 [Candidatus Paceibacterota bacterium]|jgi:hypothetical protein